MSSALEERFAEVDRVPTPWDEVAADVEEVPRRRPRKRVAAATLLAASLGAAAVLGIVLFDGNAPRVGPEPVPDASWLVGETMGSCVERYSPQTLPNRAWAFEGVIAAVDRPVGGSSDTTTEEAGMGTTTVTFDVERWFWGGKGERVSLRTYAAPSSAGDVEGSVGAHLLVSGDADFLWACGFTQPFSETLLQEFQSAAGRTK
jgi:hypothetical protein